MEPFGKNARDDLNEWSKETFNDINKMFRLAAGLDKTTEEKEHKKVKIEKPERETIIQNDEITNLQIDLGTIDTVEDFLERM